MARVLTRFHFGRHALTASAALLVAAIGTIAVVLSHAATNSLAVEPENGTVAGAASVVNDSTAANSKAVRFGASGSGDGLFHIQGTKIIDPTGKTFVPVGANVNGPEMVWNGSTVGNSAIAQTRWHWNAVRLNICWVVSANYPNWDTVWPGHPAVPAFNGCENGYGYHWNVNDDLDSIVTEYTAKKIVVMIDLQHFNPGVYPSATNMTFIEHWWQYIATRYKNNPYVWFNLLNEPGSDPSTLAQWDSVTDDLAGKVRGTGAQNIIVADGSNFGQEAYDWTCAANIPYQNSGILTYGPTLQAKYGNMLYSMHAYGEWGGGSRDQTTGCSTNATTMQAQLDTRLTNYINHVQSANLALVLGELGSPPTPIPTSDWQAGQDWAVPSVYRVAPGKGIGTLWWHGDSGSGYGILQDSSASLCSWIAIGTSSCSFTPFGQLLYNYATQINP